MIVIQKVYDVYFGGFGGKDVCWVVFDYYVIGGGDVQLFGGQQEQVGCGFVILYYGCGIDMCVEKWCQFGYVQ